MTNPQGKKIIRIIARLNIGGPTIHVTNLNYYLDKQYGYQSTLIYGALAEGEGSMEYKATEKNLQTILIPELGREISLIKDIATIWKLFKILRKEKPDIVHTHTAKAGTVGRIAARLALVPKVYHTFHGHVFHSYFSPLKTKLFIYIEKFLALLTTKIIVISEQQKQEILSYGIAPMNKFTVIPLGFELHTFRLAENYWHRKYALPANIKLIGIVGRLVPIKNHAFFLDCAQAIAKKNSEVAFLIIGDGELKETLQTQAKQLELEDKVIFTGFLTDLGRIYSDLDIVTLTSDNEGTPVTLIEAMALGKPVVSMAVGGISDIIEDGIMGHLVFERDPETFANKVIDLLNNPLKAQTFGKAAQSKTLNRFGVQRLIKDLNDLYKTT